MEIKQSVTIHRDLAEVWSLFQDIPAVARCMPGAELTEDRGEGKYAGKVSVRLGPLTTTFEGEVEHRADVANFRGVAEGKGVDRRGGSRSRMTMDYALREVEGGTELSVDANLQLSGPIAQFGRPTIVTETARLLIEQFVANIDALLMHDASGEFTPPEPGEINALKLGGRVVSGSVKRWLGKKGG
jgi:uncharacterized protein